MTFAPPSQTDPRLSINLRDSGRSGRYLKFLPKTHRLELPIRAIEEQRHLQLRLGEVSPNPIKLADGASATVSPRPDVGATPTKGKGYDRFISVVAGTRINPR